MGRVICIDPGHGGRDPGAPGTLAGNPRRYESADNLQMSLRVAELLRERGHTVILTRAEDMYLSLEARRRIALEAKADIFVSLHRNSYTDASAKGIEIWVRGKLYSGAACEVLEELAKTPNQANRGVKIGNYAVLYNTPMPAMLIELGFISNAKDNELFNQHFEAYATAIARGLLAALDEPWDNPVAPAEPLYRVQVGAFSVKDNAEAFLRILREMGLEAFIVQPGERAAE
jgi:N-acetylmuramoyl-L-alanine amidase